MINHHSAGVYQIRNLVNGKIYVGSTAKTLHKRRQQHIRDLETQRHSNRKLQNVWNKYGPSCFIFEVLVECPPEVCLLFEQIIMDRLEVVAKGYNITPTAGSNAGTKRSDAVKAKMKAGQDAMSDETRKAKAAKIAAAQTGRTHSPEAKAKMSASAKARPPFSDETRAKISEALRLRIRKPVSDETKAKIAATLRSRPPVSDEVRANISAAAKAAWDARKQKTKE